MWREVPSTITVNCLAMKIDNLLFHCEHPKQIVTKSGQRMVVSCGKCKACLVDKASQRAVPCSKQEALSKYTMFVTLTYDDEHIPYCVPSYSYSENGRQMIQFFSVVDGLLIDSVQYKHDLFRQIMDKQDRKGCKTKSGLKDFFFYADYSDLQKFLKRFRKRISQIKPIRNEKIKYYSVSEYGPVSFRPHYHLLFFFDSPLLFKVFGTLLRQSWPFGRVDYSLSRGGVSSYVSSYVNSVTSLPEIFQLAFNRPKSSHSSHLGQILDTPEFKKIYRNEPERLARFVQFRDKKGFVSYSAPWRSYKGHLFPRCYDYANKSLHERVCVYNGLFLLERLFGERRRGVDYADMLLEYLQDRIDRRLKVDSRITTAFLSVSNNPSLDEYKIPTRDILLSRVYQSIHYRRLMDTYRLSPLQLTVNIDRFYNALDYSNLKEQYEVLERVSREDEHCVGVDLLLSSYVYGTQYDTSKDYHNLNGFMMSPDMLVDFWKKSPWYQAVRAKCNERYNYSVKHKTLNDLNDIFIINK